MTAFSQLETLPAALLTNLESLGYHQMTPVQAATLPLILAGRDVRAQAQTGSGKTAAFGLGILQRLDAGLFSTQCLVLCPTRELAGQVAEELRRLARYLANIKILTLSGGQSIGVQKESLTHAPHIIVATPGRLLDHLKKQTLTLDSVRALVLDEADRMLDMGFADALDEIISYLPATRQTLLFSATWPPAIAEMSRRLQQDPQTVEVDAVDTLPAIEQQFYEVLRQDKIAALHTLLSLHQPSSCIIFCNTKKDCQEVCDSLAGEGQSALSLHGDMEQRDRDQTLIRFTNGSCRILVATDVAARGIDIKSLAMVVNYELAWDPEVHVHRIGRTARAGEQGLAISLCAPQEAQRASALAELLGLSLDWQPLPKVNAIAALPPEMATLCIDGGKKAKMRRGDVLGALTGEMGLKGEDIGKIDVHPNHIYVAIKRSVAKQAAAALQQGKIKGKTVKVRLFR